MALLLLAVSLLQSERAERVFEKAIDNTYVVVLIRHSTTTKTTFELRIEEKGNRRGFWELETFAPAYSFEFIRADSKSVVLRGVSDYGFKGPYLKLFFDLATKRILQRIEYTDTALSQISNPEAQRILGVPSEFINLLKAPFESMSPFEPRTLPPELLAAPLPQSTYADFARARPARVRDGYIKDGTNIEEVIGPYQIVGDKIWVGKNFYDGEGTTGVGAIGYYDRSARKYTFLRISEVLDWSVTNLLVEGETIWASLAGHPEGADYSGGLIRHDLKSGVTREYPITEVIHRIQRRLDRLYLPTSNGIYVLIDNRLTRYVVEPDINGRPILISEEL